MSHEMVEDAIEIILQGILQRKRMTLIIHHNRAGGDAPMIAQQIADRLHGVKLE